jgi:hypothetical protein
MKIPYALLAVPAVVATLFAPTNTDAERSDFRHLLTFPNATGVAATFSTAGRIDTSNPFFQELGTNGRSCGTCHQASDGWTITPASVQARFDATQGRDPIFRLNDGSTRPMQTCRRSPRAPPPTACC